MTEFPFVCVQDSIKEKDGMRAENWIQPKQATQECIRYQREKKTVIIFFSKPKSKFRLLTKPSTEIAKFCENGTF